jgi:peptidoglycan/LPS O-acetylase OafA/YrhL
LPQHALDNRLGDLSYGVFLNHFLIQWVLVGEPFGITAMAVYLAISLCMSALTQNLIERPILHWRQRLRIKEAS